MEKYVVKASALVDYVIVIKADSEEEALSKAKDGIYSAYDVTELGQSDWEYGGVMLLEMTQGV